MKKRKPTKYKIAGRVLREKSTSELNGLLVQLETELRMLNKKRYCDRFVNQKDSNAACEIGRYHETKRNIARVKTILSERGKDD